MTVTPVLAWIVYAAIVVFYAVLGLVILAPESVYSGDIGVKYVQAQALVDHRFASLDIPYPGEVIDPERAFFPLRPPFVMVTGGSTQAIFSPISAVTQAVAVSAFGFRGMIGLSIVAGAIVLVSSMKLAPRDLAIPVLLAVGLGGPLWFYAVSGWEHAPSAAFGTAAFAVAMRMSGASIAPLLAGALVGAGAALRDEVVLLTPGLLLAIWLRHRSWRALVATVAGVAIPLLLAAAIEVWWFGRPPAAHLRHAVHILQSALQLSDAPNPDVPVLKPMTLRERYDTVMTYWTFGRGTDRQVISFVSGLLLALFIRWRLRSSIGILIWLLAFGATTVTDLWEVVTLPKWLAGLIRVSPFVVFALLPLARERDDGTARGVSGRIDHPGAARLVTVVAITTAIYLIVAFAGVDTSGGKSLGPRLLFPLLPLLAVSAICVIASYLRADSIADRAVGWAGAGLVAMAVVIHVGGTIPAYKQRNAEDASAVLAIARSPERIVVADDMFTAQLLFPLYDRKVVLLADHVTLGQRLGALLADRGFNSALLVSRHPEPRLTLPPLKMERSDLQGRMVIQYWRR